MIILGLVVGIVIGLVIGHKIASTQCEEERARAQLVTKSAQALWMQELDRSKEAMALAAQLREDNIRLLNEKFKENAETQGES